MNTDDANQQYVIFANKELERLEKQREKDRAAANRTRDEIAASAVKHREYIRTYKKELERLNNRNERRASRQPGPADNNRDDEWLNSASPAAAEAGRQPSTGNVAGVRESKQGNDSPPVEPPPAPPVMPIPPVSAPTAPPVHGDVSPLSWLMNEAFRQNCTAIIQKLYPPIASKRAHALLLVGLIKVAGISEEEFTHLTDLHRAGNVLNFPHGDRSGISANDIKVNHVHGEQFGSRPFPARPVVIRTNAGIAKIKSFS